MKKNELITTLGVWLTVAITLFLYIFYFRRIKDFTEVIISVIPAIIFLIGGILIFSRDKKTIKRVRENDEPSRNVDLEWGLALKHDVLTYFIPVIILAFPFLTNKTPNFTDLCQAITVFLALSYLKIQYWGEL